MGTAIPVFDQVRAGALGMDVVPVLTSNYAAPVPSAEVIGICIGCDCELTERDVVIPCECWSSQVRLALPCLMCQPCWEESRNELA